MMIYICEKCNDVILWKGSDWTVDDPKLCGKCFARVRNIELRFEGILNGHPDPTYRIDWRDEEIGQCSICETPFIVKRFVPSSENKPNACPVCVRKAEHLEDIYRTDKKD
jgi:hypothetical protein